MPLAAKRVCIVAPSRRLEPQTAEAVSAIARGEFGGRIELIFHDQCFLSAGHFAGDDDARTRAFVDAANDPNIDAVWFARGGYGAGRLFEAGYDRLAPAARAKTYLGYSDTGFILARLYGLGFPHVVHGPMPADIARAGGDVAIRRALIFLSEARPAPTPSPEPVVAMNLTVLAHVLCGRRRPDFSGVAVAVEDVGEHHYRIDRALGAVLSSPAMTDARGLMLGRFSAIPENDIPFGADVETMAREWCARTGTPFLGSADIGHDCGNAIVPFGRPVTGLV